MQRAGIALAVPSQSFLLTEEKSHRDRLQTEELEQRTAVLQRLELFRSLTDDERKELAALLINAPFVRGEAITRQGDQAQCDQCFRKMFMLVDRAMQLLSSQWHPLTSALTSIHWIRLFRTRSLLISVLVLQPFILIAG